ncbi:hypothetical protein [Nocardioides sp. LHG3406-4]
MPRLIDAPSRTDTMVWGVNYLLALHGPTGVTMRGSPGPPASARAR